MKRSFAIVIACVAFAAVLGLAGCGSSGSSSGSAASGSASGSEASASSAAVSASASSASGAAASDGYVDSHGVISAKALIELDGAKLTKVVESAGYTWDEKHAAWSKVGSELSPMKGLTQEEHEAAGSSITDTSKYDFTADEVASFAAGGKGTPVRWMISSKGQYDDVAAYLADQQVTVVEQCSVEQRYGGTHIWAIVENTAGDRFLMDVEYYVEKSIGYGQINLFTADYIATESHGVASSFSLGGYLLDDAHTIDEAFAIIKSGAVS